MRNLDIQRSATVAVAFTADQWQLFDLPGRDAAATALSAALQEAVNTPGATEGTVLTAMRPVQERYADLGADDSEAEHLIEDVLEKVFGE